MRGLGNLKPVPKETTSSPAGLLKGGELHSGKYLQRPFKGTAPCHFLVHSQEFKTKPAHEGRNISIFQNQMK